MQSYFKITNQKENHHGFQYVDGLNILIEDFNSTHSCCSGGFYFTNAKNIFKFMDKGIYLRQVSLPDNDPNFMMVSDPFADAWRSNQIILGEKRLLSDISTIKYLIESEADVHVHNDLVFRWACRRGYLDIVKYLLSNGIDFNLHRENSLIIASSYGYYPMVKFFLERGTDADANNGAPLLTASISGYIEIVRLLLDNGADIHAREDEALQRACRNNNKDLVQLLIDRGADIHAKNERAFYLASVEDHIDVVKLLLKRGAGYETHAKYIFRAFQRSKRARVIDAILKHREKL